MTDSKLSQVPRFPGRIENLGWSIFLVTVSSVVASLVVQGALNQSSPCPCWNDVAILLVLAFPWLLSVTLLFASGCTLVAAQGFGKRYGAIRGQIAELFLNIPEGDDKATTPDGKLSIARPRSNSVPAENLVLQAEGLYLPAPYYGIANCRLSWTIPDYVELILKERSGARTSSGKLAAALGGAFAGGVLAYGRLAQFLQ